MTDEIEVEYIPAARIERGKKFEVARTRALAKTSRKEMVRLFREATPEAFDVIYSIMTDPAESAHNRLVAAELILARGWGRPRPAEDVQTDIIDDLPFNKLSDRELKQLEKLLLTLLEEKRKKEEEMLQKMSIGS